MFSEKKKKKLSCSLQIGTERVIGKRLLPYSNNYFAQPRKRDEAWVGHEPAPNKLCQPAAQFEFIHPALLADRKTHDLLLFCFNFL
jgi:hypothetical protein